MGYVEGSIYGLRQTMLKRKSQTTFRESPKQNFWKVRPTVQVLILLYYRKIASDAHCIEHWTGPRSVWTLSPQPCCSADRGWDGKKRSRIHGKSAQSWLWDKNLNLIHINVIRLNRWEVCQSVAVSNCWPVLALIIRTILPQSMVGDWRFYPAIFHDGILLYI
jgi:hypothetical protein